MSSTPDDLDLAAYARSGDPEVLARLFDRVAPRLLLLAAHWTADPAEAEDLVQTTFLHVVRDASGYDPERPALRWLGGILAHRAIERRRLRRGRDAARGLEVAADEQTLAAANGSPLDAAIDAEVVERVAQAVEGLAEPYREVLVLRLTHGLSPTAIAHALGRSPAAVRKQLERGRDLLRRVLPASFAGVLAALTLPCTGIAQVRRIVLDAAAPTVGVGVPLAGIYGGLIVKKVVVVAAALAVAACVWLWFADRGVDRPDRLDPDAGMSIPRAQQGATVARSGEARGRREVRARRSAAAVADGALLVRVTVAGSGDPASGIGVRVIPRDGRDERIGEQRDSTSSGGSARFDGLSAGVYAVDVGPRARVLAEVAAGATTSLDVEVPSGRRLRGLVTSPAGEPVGAAQVWCYPLVGQRGRSPAWLAATCDEHGAFELAVFEPHCNLVARHPQFAESTLHVLTAASCPQPLVLPLRPGPSDVELRITRGGAWVGGASVELRRPAGGTTVVDGGLTMPYASRFVRSDAVGRVALRGLQPGPATLVVLAHGGAPQARELELLPGQRQTITIELEPAGIVRGRVVDPRGAPVADVTVASAVLGASAQATTTGDGAFELDDLPVGDVELTAYGAESWTGARAAVRTDPERAVAVTLVVEPLPLIEGRVVDAVGRPLEGFVVHGVRCDLGRGFVKPVADDRQRWDFHAMRRATTAADGAFVLRVMPDVDYLLDVVQPGQWQRVLGERFGAQRAPRRDLVLTVGSEDLATARIVGRLVDVAGAPLPGASFTISDGSATASPGRNCPGTERSLPDGTFEIGPLPPRSYQLTIHPPGEVRTPLVFDELALAPHATRDLGDVALPTAVAVVVQLRSADGRPVEGALAQFACDGGQEVVRRFAADGRLDAALAPGRYEAVFYGGGFASRKRTIDVRAGVPQAIEVEVVRAMRFALLLNLPDGEREGRVVLRGPDGEVDFEQEVEADDPFGARWQPSLVPGVHDATLECASGRRYRASFVVAEQEAAPGTKPEPHHIDWQAER